MNLSHYWDLIPAKNSQIRRGFEFKFGLDLSPSRESSSKSQIRREFEFGSGVDLSHYWDVIPA